MKITTIFLAAAILLSTTAHAALVASPNGQTIYDTDLNVTWLANTNLAATNSFGVNGINADGSMHWNTAQSWISAMNASNYMGYSDWRLPTTNPANGRVVYTGWSFDGSTDFGYNISAQGTAYAGSIGSEMSHLYYYELGNKGFYNTAGELQSGEVQSGNGFVNASSFYNLKPWSFYWSGTVYDPYNDGFGSSTEIAWYFTSYGMQYSAYGSSNFMNALAVRTGQVSAVPVPAAAWLLGSGLLGLIGIARRKTT